MSANRSQPRAGHAPGTFKEKVEGSRVAYLVELEAMAGQWGSVPAAVRLRRLLKLAARSCGLRVVSLEALTDPQSAGTVEQAAADKGDAATHAVESHHKVTREAEK